MPQQERTRAEESALPAFPLLVEPEEVWESPRGKSHVAGRTGQYAALRAICVGYKILAGSFAAAAVAGLIYAIHAAATVPLGAERAAAIYTGLGLFLGGGLAALGHFALGELIRVVLDIEERTRPR